MIDRGEKLRKLVMKFLVASGLSHVVRPLLGGQGVILMLHRVTREPGTTLGFNRNLCIDPDFLDRLIAEMKAQRFEFISVDEAIGRIGRKPGNRRFAAITLDDGFRDNLVEALPVFEKHQTPFSVYIAPGLIDGTTEPWWDLVEAIVEDNGKLVFTTKDGPVSHDCSTREKKAAVYNQICDYLTGHVAEEDQTAVVRGLARSAGMDYDAFRQRLLMTWDEVRKIAAHPLCTIGAHTVHHYNLKRLSFDKAFEEMSESAKVLETKLGKKPRHLAYPYGFKAAVGEREAKIAEDAGFVSALTTRHGMIQSGHTGHLHTLPRLSVNGRYQNMDYINAMLSGVTTPMANRGRTLVTV